MEEAFLGLVQDVISIGYGDRDNLDPDVSAMEEAALYKHFGQAAGTYKTFADRPGEPKKATVLFDFIRLLKNPTNKELKPAEREHANEMLRGFSAFQKRLAEGHVDVDHLALTIDAITALDDYAFNKLFAGWYQGGNEPLEVSELDNVIPGRMGKLPPREFYFYPFSYHRNQDELAVQAYKEKLWREIKEHVSPKFQESTSVPSSSSAAIPLAFSPDGKFLVSAGLRLRLRVWDPLTGIEKPRIGPENARFGAVAFSPDGKHLATIERDGSVILFDLTRDAATRRLGQLPAFNPISCQALGFSSDGTMLAAAGITLAILWDVASGTELCKVPGHSIQSIALSPDGKYVALGEKTGIAIIWDWEKKRQSGSLNHSAACTSCDFSHDGRLLATCTSDGGLKIWDLNNRSSYFSTRLAHPPSRTSNVTFSPKGQFIASGGNLGRINVLDLAKKSRVYSLSGHEDVSFITFSPNECLMASAGFSDGDATVRIWDLKEGKVVRSFQAR
jgi:dipeptidyl aminopeptidase/acylaminoacyl peptidase